VAAQAAEMTTVIRLAVWLGRVAISKASPHGLKSCSRTFWIRPKKKVVLKGKIRIPLKIKLDIISLFF
jgi:hypothetical protein